MTDVPASSSPRSTRDLLWAAVVVLLTAWPWAPNLDMPPVAADAPRLLADCDPQGTWWEWAASSPHFGVTWRPVAMLSITLDLVLGGGSIPWLRAVDLLLHLVGSLGLFALARRLPGMGRAGAWLVLLLWVLHPVLEEILPHLPRRPYPLCLAFGAWGTWLGLSPDLRRRQAVGSGVLLALAFGSHEGGAFWMLATGLLGIALDRGAGLAWPSRAVRRSGLTGVLALLLIVGRKRVLGEGGYDAGDHPLSVLGIVEKMGEALFGVPSPWAWLGWGGLLLAAGVAFRKGDPAQRLFALAIVAAVAIPAYVLGLQEVWFDRIATTMLPLVALLVGWLAVGASPSVLFRGVALLPLALALPHSPVLWGTHPVRTPFRQDRAALITGLQEAVREAREGQTPAVIRLVIPYRAGKQDVEGRGQAAGRVLPRDARQPWTWVQQGLTDDTVVLDPWLYVLEGPDLGPSGVQVTEQDGALGVLLPTDRSVLRVGHGTAGARRRPEEAGPFEPFRLPERVRGRTPWIFVHVDGTSRWQRVEGAR